MKKRILITVDHKWRDLPDRAYLAEILSTKHNFKVYLARDGDEVKYWRAFKPNVVVVNHILEIHKRNWIKNLPQEVKVVILPTEGITAYTKDMVNILGGDREEYKLVRALLSWVDFLEDYWSSDCFLPKERIYPVGVPRFDFFFSPEKRIIFKKPEYLRKKMKLGQNTKIITFFLNFVYATAASRNIELWRKILIRQGYDPKLHIEMAYKDLEAREKFIITIQEVIEHFPNYIFLIKPHPNEDFLFYKKRIKKHPHIRFIPNLYSIEALLISDLIIQRRCTTGLESAILDIPAIDYNYELPDLYNGDLVEGIWPEATSKEELLDLITKWEKGDLNPWFECKEERKRRIEKWCGFNKGKAIEKAAEIISKIAEEADYYHLDLFQIIKDKVRYYFVSSLKDVYRKIFPDRWGRYSKAPNFLDFWQWRRKIKILNA
ncbi:MAG: hypothetical protein DRP76_01465 [Candidatus Omnitrophota bacterium]|nr:MAG: hypothetical protein DRP76_01465 [Candidatus Omnitrophota bacterium]